MGSWACDDIPFSPTIYSPSLIRHVRTCKKVSYYPNVMFLVVHPNSIISLTLCCPETLRNGRLQFKFHSYCHTSLPYTINLVIDAIHLRSGPTPSHCAMCQCVECRRRLLLLLVALFECWFMHMPHHLGRPRGVDHNNSGERRLDSISIVSHATLILQYHVSMLILQNSETSRAL